MYWWVARFEDEDGRVKYVLRVVAPVRGDVMPEDEMIVILRAHLRTGVRKVETMVMGAEGVFEYEVSLPLHNAISTRVAEGSDAALEDVAVVTMIANAAAQAILSGELPIAEGLPLEDIAAQWSAVRPKAIMVTLAVLNFEIMQSQGLRSDTRDGRDEMILEMTRLAHEELSKGDLPPLLDYGLMEACLAAWELQRQQNDLAAAQAAAKTTAPETVEIGALTPVDGDQEEAETAAPAPPVRRRVQDRPRRRDGAKGRVWGED
ncbi:hypothetical protein HOI83_01675 [Candidatus Uhrbacteria bacterium]|nr:hypothetical protein [Candidatus Uhrbacteria bacterium]